MRCTATQFAPGGSLGAPSELAGMFGQEDVSASFQAQYAGSPQADPSDVMVTPVTGRAPAAQPAFHSLPTGGSESPATQY